MTDEPDSESGKREIAGVAVSSTGRRVFPRAELSKGEVAEYYAAMADRMLEHAGHRPLSLLRCPDGISEDCFFQKHAGKGFPDAVKTIPIEEKKGSTRDYMYVASAEGIVGAVQMGTLEFHIWGASRDRIERPDRMVFDLDPDEGLDFDKVIAAARQMHDALGELGLDSAALVTGGKGVHVVVPLRRIVGWDRVKRFARDFAKTFARRYPDRYTAKMSKSEREGRVFIDWLRNERGATAIAPYSLRARPGAAVALPVGWNELETLDCANGFHMEDAQDRLSRACPLGRPKAHGIGKQVMKALDDWSKD